MIVAERVTGAARDFLQQIRVARSAWLQATCACVLLVALPFVLPLDGRPHADWLQFLGRFHPALLHLPIGLIALVPVLEIAATKRPVLREAADFVLRAALALALPTLALGYMLAYGAGDTGTTVTRHMWGAIALCIGLMLCILFRPTWALHTHTLVYPALLTLTLLVLIWTGHEGGSITHGNDYLTAYMPGRLRVLFRTADDPGTPANSFYALQIHPVFEAKCVACHGAATEKGDLRLDTYTNVLRGGKDGAAVAPGKPEASLLLARVTLSPGDPHFMPAEGRTPLTSDEVSAIRAWIRSGATASTISIPGMKLATGNTEPPPQPVGDYSHLMPEIIQMQQRLGAKLVPVSSKASDGLILRTVDVASSFGDAQLAEFQKFAPYIVEAELARTVITDASFDTIRTFTDLRTLHLEGTAITGANLAKLTSLTQLTYLNLSGTRVSAQSISPLKSMPHLRHLYLFNTPAQPDEATRKEQSMTRALDTPSRRAFLASAGATALASTIPTNAHASEAFRSPQVLPRTVLTGNGEWTYQVATGWGTLPTGITFGGTHGAVAQDKAGNIYVSTQSESGILVYDSRGHLLTQIAKAFPEVHSMVHAEEDGVEYLYTTVQKGTPKENWLFVKMKTDGTPVMKITAPPEAGFKSPNEWRLTAAVPAPDGSMFIANGYGDSRILHFDRSGNYLRSYSGKGSDPGLLNCSHGLTVDTRYTEPMLLVCDRENRRLCHFDLDGKYVSTVTEHLRRPCQISLFGDYAIVSELEGRVTVLDRDNVPVAFLGDNPDKSQWANYDLDPESIAAANFSAAHGCFVDREANIYVSDWNHTGRVKKLSRVRA